MTAIRTEANGTGQTEFNNQISTNAKLPCIIFSRFYMPSSTATDNPPNPFSHPSFTTILVTIIFGFYCRDHFCCLPIVGMRNDLTFFSRWLRGKLIAIIQHIIKPPAIPQPPKSSVCECGQFK